MAHNDILSQPDRGLGLDRPQTEAFHRRVQEEGSRPLQRRQARARGHGRVRTRQEHRGEVDQVDKRDRLAARRGQPHARAEPDPGARAREPQAPDGGRRLKTSGAGIRSEVRARPPEEAVAPQRPAGDPLPLGGQAHVPGNHLGEPGGGQARQRLGDARLGVAQQARYVHVASGAALGADAQDGLQVALRGFRGSHISSPHGRSFAACWDDSAPLP